MAQAKRSLKLTLDLAQLYRAPNNPDLAQSHYTSAHQLYTQLGAAKDLETIEQEWGESIT